MSKQAHELQDDPYKEPSFLTTLGYDLFVWLMGQIFNCFFREIRPRGAFRIPKTGPCIFVAAPHANQFVDPVILMGQVKNESQKRVSFLIAEKSMKVFGVGHLARFAMTIGVKRPQDNLRKATGTISYDVSKPLEIIGKGTKFTLEATVKGLIGLPSSKGNAEILEIINDEKLLIKKEFKKPAIEQFQEFPETSFKLADKVDQSEVYKKVFAHLSHGHSIGIFPEGGSHDRTDLLPLKAGVAIMALGAMANDPNCNVKIIPCGMNYFHPHKFRSRAVVEFGHPIEIPKHLAKQYEDPENHKQAVQELLDTITQGLKAVTVTCPDYETLMVVQAARRLYTNEKTLPIPLIVEINRRLVIGYNHFKEHPEIIELREKIMNYNEKLKQLHLPDHEVNNAAQVNLLKNSYILIHRSIKLLLLLILSLPGIVLFTPVFIIGKAYSNKKKSEALANSLVKIKANDVVATWKILIGIGLAPLLYIFYSCLGVWYFREYSSLSRISTFIVIYIASATVTYSALIFGDTGMDIFKSLRPVYLSLVSPEILKGLKLQRKELAEKIVEIVNKFGPELFPDFDHLTNWQSLDHDVEKEEDAKTRELRKRRILSKKTRKLQRKEIENLANTKQEILENTQFFTNNSDVESDNLSSSTSSTSLSSLGESNDGSTGLSDKIRETLRERRVHDQQQE
ncbi:glycerol-3-phosphate O-acyltransferase / dihydroxyacetone phosphate acyltransferase [Wickerhamomyces ciferrii]|uniref:Glycerol-3-phosphate O-acyltransferase / dihydroxyacetone phosphate acyltransferase n=1 Tax=Wickerhamomyces ciferrii (strain ATCC 14091 / BCRC 22168 / CBS 111 / JCM 3599 / NBRC 0793 / NRRL Y-1031 F-60-10) TaxID=1206466 RepID=K0KH08_WICCF|nr:glycerol-3-phosphate O-acyltransferase / dihydroxyacetone phosphate acyltransferase [Wickerhamomyces ciferrii]CCH44490.1 glycerol-3-phosphate O-acyltransferase / dihydroxyacetone phosphate acyltransferase [Wickerhamomyces ciferrii]